MKWIKASEKLPEEAKLVFIKGKGIYMIVGRYIEERTFDNTTYPAMFRDFSNNAKLNWSFEEIEWLDESINQELGQKVGHNVQVPNTNTSSQTLTHEQDKKQTL